jgi:hypothetical protein
MWLCEAHLTLPPPFGAHGRGQAKNKKLPLGSSNQTSRVNQLPGQSSATNKQPWRKSPRLRQSARNRQSHWRKQQRWRKQPQGADKALVETRAGTGTRGASPKNRTLTQTSTGERSGRPGERSALKGDAMPVNQSDGCLWLLSTENGPSHRLLLRWRRTRAMPFAIPFATARITRPLRRTSTGHSAHPNAISMTTARQATRFGISTQRSGK